MSFNNDIYNLWHSANQDERGDYIPKFVIEPKDENADILFFTLNASLPTKVNEYYRRWMQDIGWIWDWKNRSRWRENFKWEKSPLPYRYDHTFVELSAKLHHGSRGYNGEGHPLYPRFFRRLNEIVARLGIQQQTYPECPELKLYNYAHVDLYFWLDSSSREIRKRIEDTPRFAEAQKTIAFSLLEAWRPRTIICPYSSVRQDISCFCRTHGVVPNFRPLANGRVQIAEANLQWGNVLIIICKNLLGGRGNGGVNPCDFSAIVRRVRDF
jgi:hypothetical protein